MAKIHLLMAAAMGVATVGCSVPGLYGKESHGMGSGKMAVATLSPTMGNTAKGEVMFRAMGDHVMVHAHITGLAPNTVHGFHLHEIGNCASADGTSAGGHFNPSHTVHGPQEAEHHAGDMPSLKADSSGVADEKFALYGISLAPGPTGIDARAVIVHAGPDDYKTQPTGASGARIACGVIAVN